MLKEEIDNIVNELTNFLVKDNVNLQTEMTSVKIIGIITEVHRLLNQAKSFVEDLKEMDRDNIVRRTVEMAEVVVNDRRIKNIISQGQVDSILKVLREKETLVTIVEVTDDVAEGVAEAVLETLDDNEDGKVTSTEVSNNCTCCGNKKLAKCWGKFFINFLCCGKNNVKVYKHNEALEGVELDGIVIQETPVIEEKSAEPLAEETPVVEPETAVVEPEPVVEETPVVEPEPVVETPVVEPETAVVEPEPVVEETPVVEPEPVVEETPVVEPETVVENISVKTHDNSFIEGVMLSNQTDTIDDDSE